jgi:hypothetical protein
VCVCHLDAHLLYMDPFVAQGFVSAVILNAVDPTFNFR